MMDRKGKIRLALLIPVAVIFCVWHHAAITQTKVVDDLKILELRTEPEKKAKIGDSIYLILKWECPQGKVLRAHIRSSIVGGRDIINDTLNLPAETNVIYIFLIRFGHVNPSTRYSEVKSEVYLLDENGNTSEKKNVTLMIYP